MCEAPSTWRANTWPIVPRLFSAAYKGLIAAPGMPKACLIPSSSITRTAASTALILGIAESPQRFTKLRMARLVPFAALRDTTGLLRTRRTPSSALLIDCLLSARGILVRVSIKARFACRQQRFEFRQALAQAALFVEATGFIANDRCDRRRFTLCRIQHSHRKCDGQRAPVFVRRRHSEQVGAVPGFPGTHGLVIAIPVTLAQPLGNDQIKRLAHSLAFREAEHALGRGIPHRDGAACVGHDDGIANGRHELTEVDCCGHCLLPLIHRIQTACAERNEAISLLL